MQNPFSALKCRNFRIYWLGLGASQTGTWMQNIAQPWLALKVTNDPVLVGIVSAMHFLPIMIFSLFSGVLIDRMDKKRILFFTQAGLCVVSFIFALSVFMDFASFGVILVLAFLTGLFNSLDSPTRHSFIYELVENHALVPNAVALNSMSVSVSRILGPALAGIIMASFGIGACFLFNTFSFVAIFASLFLVKPKRARTARAHSSMLKSIIKGFIYIKSHEHLLSPLIVLLIVATFVPNYSVLVSALVHFNLGGDDTSYGYLMAFLGVGAFFGAFFAASLGQNLAKTSKNSKEILNQSTNKAQKSSQILNAPPLNQKKPALNTSQKITLYLPFLSALMLASVGIWDNFWLCGLSLIFTSFCLIITISTINSLLQLGSDDKYRGRVMSVYSLFFLGSTPIGASFAGFAVKHFGPDGAFFISAFVASFFLGLWHLFAKKF